MTGPQIKLRPQQIDTPMRGIEGGHIDAPPVSGVGDALAKLGATVQQFALDRMQEKVEADTAAVLAQHQVDVEKVIIEERDRATDGAAGMSAAVQKRLEQMRTDRLKSAGSPMAKRFLSARLLAANADATQRAMEFESTEAHKYNVDRFSDAGDAIAQSTALNPGQLGQRLDEYQQLVNASPSLTADERRTLIHNTTQRASTAVAEAQLTRDPSGTLADLRRSLGVPDGHDSKSAELADVFSDYEAVLRDGGTEEQAQKLVSERMAALGGTKGQAFDVTAPGTVPGYIAALPVAQRVALLGRAENEAGHRAARDTANSIWQRSGGNLDTALGMIAQLPDAKLADDVEGRVRLLHQDAHQAKDQRERDVRESLIGQVQMRGLDSLSEPERNAAAVLGIMPSLHEMEKDRVAGRDTITDPAVEGSVIASLRTPGAFDKLDFTRPEFLRGLSNADRLKYQQLQQSRRDEAARTGKKPPLLSATAEELHDIVDQHIRVDLGLDPKVRESLKPRDFADRNRANAYTAAMSKAVDMWAAAHGGERPDQTTVQKISDRLLLRIPVVPGFGNEFAPKGDTVRGFEAEHRIRSAEQIPPKYRAEIAQRLKAGGYPVDEAHVLRYYIDGARMGVFK